MLLIFRLIPSFFAGTRRGGEKPVKTFLSSRGSHFLIDFLRVVRWVKTTCGKAIFHGSPHFVVSLHRDGQIFAPNLAPGKEKNDHRLEGGKLFFLTN